MAPKAVPSKPIALGAWSSSQHTLLNADEKTLFGHLQSFLEDRWGSCRNQTTDSFDGGVVEPYGILSAIQTHLENSETSSNLTMPTKMNSTTKGSCALPISVDTTIPPCQNASYSLIV